ncbi:MAG: hypothetical protein R6X12_00265 [bacterium]
MRKQHLAFAAGPLVLVLVLAASAAVAFAAENQKPCLCQPMIRPIDGVARRAFVASVRYMDPDGDAPALVQVNISGTAYPLRLAKGRANDGIYQARLTLPEGEHEYFFYAEDGRGGSERFPRYGAKPGPSVGQRRLYNRPAFLTGGGVHYQRGSDKNVYTFTVHYRDRDICKPPRSVKAIVDGIANDMTLHKGTANNGIYVYQAMLPAGPHAYYFVATDGDGDCVTLPAHGFLRGPDVSESMNLPPRLSDNRIMPPTGGHRTNYTYSIHCKDEDLDVPAVALVYVNDIPHQLTLAAGKPYEGIYQYRARHHIGWDHEYYFYFEDGRGGSVRFPEVGAFHGPVVTK